MMMAYTYHIMAFGVLLRDGYSIREELVMHRRLFIYPIYPPAPSLVPIPTFLESQLTKPSTAPAHSG